MTERGEALSSTEARTGKPVALVVDDDQDIRTFVSLTLNLEGLDAHAVPGGREALDYLADNRPDLVILDQAMPEITGLEVAAKMRKDGYAGPAILFSAYMDRAMATKCDRLDLHPVSKIDVDAFRRIVKVLAGEMLGRPLT